MSEARRLVIIDDDPEIVAALRSTFTFPDFVVDAFADPREALLKLHDLAPDLILCSLDARLLPGRSVLRVVKRSRRLREIPFVFLCSDATRDDEVDSLEDGADDFFAKPVDVPVMVARLRALLRLMGRLSRPEERAETVTGSVGAAGALRLLRFCEDFRLTGQLSVEAPGARHWAEFAGGELVRAGREPHDDGVDPLDALLAVREGSYRIEHKRIDTAALADAQRRASPGSPEPEEPAAIAAPAAVVLPGGRLSMVRSLGGDLQIQTEAENRPHFAITTVVVRHGRVLRRIESAWQHALRRGEEQSLARQQVDEQHDRVVASLRERAQDGGAREADGALLAWALERVAVRAGALLGATAGVALLRRAHKGASVGNPGLAAFDVNDTGGVSFDPAEGDRVSTLTISGVAAWITGFLAEAVSMRPEVATIDLREATRGAGDDLERCGLYAALGVDQGRPS